MNPNLERALLLFQQSRHELAENELRQALAAEPDDPYGHSLLALCLLHREKFPDATAEAQQGVHLAPGFSFGYYALARVFFRRNRPDEAEAAINEAIRLDPQDADYLGLLAEIHLSERRWPAALEAAQRGLQFDSEHVGCLNLMAVALVKLGRKAEAGRTIGNALARNPDNSLTHANQGWTLLEQNDARKALEHFREALRLDPENEWARRGIVEALKARNFAYALMLRYFLAMAKLRGQAQWGILLGAYFGNQVLGQLARSKPEWAPWIMPIRILYAAFALMTWVASPLFNLVLRLNRFGRLALSAEETVASNWLAGCLAGVLFSLAGCAVYGFNSPWLLLGMVFAFLVLPLTGVFRCPVGWPRRTMAIYTAAAALMGFLAAGLLTFTSGVSNSSSGTGSDPGDNLLLVFIFATIGSGWIVNILMMQRQRH